MYIAVVAFAIFALVALVQMLSSKQLKVNMDQGPLSYVKFVYANFLKPHDKKAADQQDALESFYRTQVRILSAQKRCNSL